jgi:hypothetical protein
MRGLGQLIEQAQPSVVAIQSGVLVLFVLAFVVLVIKLFGSDKQKQGRDICQRALED